MKSSLQISVELLSLWVHPAQTISSCNPGIANICVHMGEHVVRLRVVCLLLF